MLSLFSRRRARQHVTAVCAGLCLTSCSDSPAELEREVASVVVTPNHDVLIDGMTKQLSAILRDAHGNLLSARQITWSTSDANVLAVSTTGLVTIVSFGTATITATSGGKHGSAELTAVHIPVVSVEVTPATTTMAFGSTQQFTARPLSNTGAPLPNRVVTWSSSDESKLRVDATGFVTAVGAGSATIIATSEGVSAHVPITIIPHP
jgi:uncharacterized protein YjdB